MAPFRSRPLARAAAALLVLAGLVGAALAAGLHGSPYGRVAEELLARLHAEPVACPVGLDDAVVCFVVDPARVAPCAEAIEAYVAEHGGALTIGPWSSGNGAYQVTIAHHDDLAGGLEVWLAETGTSRVEGRLEHVPRRRD
ncbi:MAG: hypothetical protein P1P87_02350 [Trueperaceae bacterium]|nr:hypothetical protein [Trueperaceae bacterium]